MGPSITAVGFLGFKISSDGGGGFFNFKPFYNVGTSYPTYLCK